jgi:hypothetical protein
MTAPKIRTKYWAKPIPTRQCDWSAVTDNYEPGHPIGYGPTESEAVEDLRSQLEDRDDEDLRYAAEWLRYWETTR